MKRFLPVAAGVGVVLALAALASYITTSVHLLSCLPAGEVRLKVIDRNGQPVKGAVLRVYQEGSRDLAYEYPLDNHLPGQDLTSNDSGVIVAIRKHSPQFCVHAWW